MSPISSFDLISSLCFKSHSEILFIKKRSWESGFDKFLLIINQNDYKEKSVTLTLNNGE